MATILRIGSTELTLPLSPLYLQAFTPVSVWFLTHDRRHLVIYHRPTNQIVTKSAMSSLIPHVMTVLDDVTHVVFCNADNKIAGNVLYTFDGSTIHLPHGCEPDCNHRQVTTCRNAWSLWLVPPIDGQCIIRRNRGTHVGLIRMAAATMTENRIVKLALPSHGIAVRVSTQNGFLLVIYVTKANYHVGLFSTVDGSCKSTCVLTHPSTQWATNVEFIEENRFVLWNDGFDIRDGVLVPFKLDLTMTVEIPKEAALTYKEIWHDRMQDAILAQKKEEHQNELCNVKRRIGELQAVRATVSNPYDTRLTKKMKQEWSAVEPELVHLTSKLEELTTQEVVLTGDEEEDFDLASYATPLELPPGTEFDAEEFIATQMPQDIKVTFTATFTDHQTDHQTGVCRQHKSSVSKKILLPNADVNPLRQDSIVAMRIMIASSSSSHLLLFVPSRVYQVVNGKLRILVTMNIKRGEQIQTSKCIRKFIKDGVPHICFVSSFPKQPYHIHYCRLAENGLFEHTKTVVLPPGCVTRFNDSIVALWRSQKVVIGSLYPQPSTHPSAHLLEPTDTCATTLV